MSEDYSVKYKKIKKRIREIEEENDTLTARLYNAKKTMRHLKVERKILLEKIVKDKPRVSTMADSDHSDIGSDIDLHDEAFLHKPGKHARVRAEKTPSKVQRKKKDPNAPKGPGNVFFLYCRLEREKLKDEVPTENPGEVTKLLGQKWKSLTKEEKQQYYDMFDKESREHDIALKSYTSANGIVPEADFSSVQPTAMSSDYSNIPLVPLSEDSAMEEDQHTVTDSQSDIKSPYGLATAPLLPHPLPHQSQQSPVEQPPPSVMTWAAAPGNEHPDQQP